MNMGEMCSSFRRFTGVIGCWRAWRNSDGIEKMSPQATGNSRPVSDGLIDDVDETMQVNRHIERRQAILSGSDRLGEKGIHLPDVEGIAAGKVGRHINETVRNIQIL